MLKLYYFNWSTGFCWNNTYGSVLFSHSKLNVTTPIFLFILLLLLSLTDCWHELRTLQDNSLINEWVGDANGDIFMLFFFIRSATERMQLIFSSSLFFFCSLFQSVLLILHSSVSIGITNALIVVQITFFQCMGYCQTFKTFCSVSRIPLIRAESLILKKNALCV